MQRHPPPNRPAPTPAAQSFSQPPRRDPLGGLALHLLAGLVAALLLATPLVADLEQRVGLQWLFHLRGARPAPEAVAVVAIDAPAAHRLGLPLKPGDWPRSIHAHLIDALAGAGARVIVFDLSFATPAKLPEDDARLAAAIGRAGNVVLVDALRRESTPARAAGTVAADPMPVDRPLPPLPPFARAALAHTAFPLPKQGRVDAYWTFIATAGDLPSMPVVAFQAYTRDELGILLQRSGTDPATRPALDDNRLVGDMLLLRALLGGQPGSSTLRLQAASADPAGTETLRKLVDIYAGDDARYLDFYGPPRTIATLSYADALAVAGAASFAGKAVFVGFSGASAAEQDRVRDHYPTVFSREDGVDLSGVEIAATAFANLLEARAVHPLPLGLQLVLAVLLGCALGALAYLLPQGFAYAALLVAGAIYLTLAHLAFVAGALALPLLVPLGLQLPLAALGGTWQRYRLERRRNQALRRDSAGHAVFEGFVSLESGGGFASVRSRPQDLGMPGASDYVLELRGDGKRYKLNLRTDDAFDGLSYQAAFETTAGTWTVLRLQLAAFRATLRGRAVAGAPPLDTVAVRQIGLVITDRQSGSFALALRSIGVE